MTVSLTINGTSYDYPQTGDLAWGPDATEWAQAVTSGMLQKAGGTFQLLADVNFGTTYGLLSQYYKTRTANIADAGQFRLARADVISWRNQANSANLDLSVDASNNLLFNGTAIGNIITVSDTATIDLTIVANDLTAAIINDSITNAMINSAAAIAYSKLNLSNSILNADINASAAIVFSKMAALTASRVPVLDGSGFITASSVTATTLGYLDATSSIQTQLDGKQASGSYITALTGDVTASGPGSVAATIANSAVTNAKMANMANITFKGNISGGAAAPSDLTATQVTANLNALVGDAGAGGTKGLAPAPAAGDAAANKFLKADGTWAAPAGAGDVVGPASATDNGFVRFDGTTGKLIKDSAATIANADVAVAAAIALNKLAATTASRALVSDGSGFVSAATTTSTEIGYVNGVTSAIQTQLDAKQLRSVLTTKGDLYVATASDTVARQGVGTNGYVLTASSGDTNGVAYALPVNDSAWINNVGIAASVAANALTVAIKNSAGSDASATSPIYTSFGNSTITTGQFSVVALTGALSLVVSSGSTLGQQNGIAADIYVYLINNSGTIKIGLSRIKLPEDALYTTVAEGGAGGADSSSSLYSDAVYANVRVRCVGKITSTQATAGTWATAPSSITVNPLPEQYIGFRGTTNAGQAVTNGNAILFEDPIWDDVGGYDTTTGVYTFKVIGKFRFSACCTTDSVSASIGNSFVIEAQKDAAFYSRGKYDVCENTTSRIFVSIITDVIDAVVGTTLTFVFAESLPAVNLTADGRYNYMAIEKIS